jgi:hypothetical protein
MGTQLHNQPSKLQTELDGAAAGLISSNLSLLNSLVILGVSMSKAEIITKLKAYSLLFTAVTNARQVYAAAVKSRKGSMADILAFYHSFVTALKQALGPNNEGLLPGFAVSLPKARNAASPETKAIAKVKAKATRQARGTMGKQQRLAITATPSMTVQVLGPDGQPVDGSASSPSVPTPTVTAPTPSGAGSKPTA